VSGVLDPFSETWVDADENDLLVAFEVIRELRAELASAEARASGLSRTIETMVGLVLGPKS
jgi:hypothetical protein